MYLCVYVSNRVCMYLSMYLPIMYLCIYIYLIIIYICFSRQPWLLQCLIYCGQNSVESTPLVLGHLNGMAGSRSPRFSSPHYLTFWSYRVTPKSKNRHIMKILSNGLATCKNLPLLKHLSQRPNTSDWSWWCKHSGIWCQSQRAARWQCKAGKREGFPCSWWKWWWIPAQISCRAWAKEALAAGGQLRNEDKEQIYQQIRMDSSKGDDLNIKALRESLGRVAAVCRYFCKILFFLIEICNYTITDFNQKNDLPL